MKNILELQNIIFGWCVNSVRENSGSEPDSALDTSSWIKWVLNYLNIH